MDTYWNQLREFLSQPRDGTDIEDGESVVEYLWNNNPLTAHTLDERVKKAEAALSPFFDTLSYEDADNLFDLIAKLCLAYEYAAFRSGLQLGTRLITELNS